MTRQERLDAMRFLMRESDVYSLGIYDALTATKGSLAFRDTVAANAAHAMVMSAHYANKVLDHLAALEQQAIDAYLAEVPLPEGWREERSPGGACHYIDGEDYTRVSAGRTGFVADILSSTSIPLAVLVRAAVQCHRLREGKA